MSVLVFVLAGAMLGIISAFARAPWLRAATYASLVAALLLVWHFSLGLPRAEYVQVPAGTVLAYSLDEPHAIYLWILPDGSTQPLSIWLPWSSKAAGALVDVSRIERRAHGHVKIRAGGRRLGLQAPPEFYGSRVRPLPVKIRPHG
jgi:hypothetical protein